MADFKIGILGLSLGLFDFFGIVYDKNIALEAVHGNETMLGIILGAVIFGIFFFECLVIPPIIRYLFSKERKEKLSFKDYLNQG